MVGVVNMYTIRRHKCYDDLQRHYSINVYNHKSNHILVFFFKESGCDSNTLIITYNRQLNACPKVGARVIHGPYIERKEGACVMLTYYVVTFASRLVFVYISDA